MTSTESTPSAKAVVLLSGGLDSSTVLAMAMAEGYETYAISFDYHQRHRIELEAAKTVASRLGVRKHLVALFDLREIGGSALTSDIEVPVSGMADNETAGEALNVPTSIPVTYVPARNTIFLSFALAWAEVLGAAHIFIGANVVDYSGYPDCRPEYLAAYEHMANLATKAGVEGSVRFSIQAPLLSLTKAAIISKGTALGVDYGLTWSCYNPQKRGAGGKAGPSRPFGEYQPCGNCDSCRLRRKGFEEAGLEDPLGLLYTTHVI